jgi:hypothetical protein
MDCLRCVLLDSGDRKQCINGGGGVILSLPDFFQARHLAATEL